MLRFRSTEDLGDAPMPGRGRRRPGSGGGPVPDALRALVAGVRFELVPTRSAEAAIGHLPPGAPVSVTCSPVKGIEPTLELTARLRDLGHDAVPHLSARLVEDRAHVGRIGRWLHDHDVAEIFVIAGDAPTPIGPYDGALAFLRALLDADPSLRRVGVAAYPDGHPLIDAAVLRDALRAKQAVLAEAGIAGSATTQMCFDAARIRHWLGTARDDGLTLSVDLGVPGVVDRAKLMAMGVRLGVGTSLSFLRKNRAAMVRLLTPGGYDPTALLASLAGDATALGITGVHSFTFNSVAATAAWQAAVLRP